jgi:NADH-quinone oxidoreductase subunit H
LVDYNYPGMAWAVENWGVILHNMWIAVLFGKIIGCYFLHVGKMDHTKV